MFRRSLVSALLICSAFSQVTKPPVERAREVVDLLLAEKYETLFQSFTPEMQKAVSLDTLKNQVGPSIRNLGKVESIGTPTVQNMAGTNVAVVPVKFATLAVNVQVAINREGAISGLVLRPDSSAAAGKWTRPSYSKPDSFTEREVIVGEGEWQLSGTLTVPKAAGPVPAIVLVHGSGPNDRDETVFAHKVFKDLAEGLSSRGLAVLRYEKRTRAYAAKMTLNKNLTVQEETIEDAVAAVALLRTQSGINPDRVFVLGHSLGGYLLPRILKQAPKAAGGISLAGSTRPLEDLILEQTEYLASLNPTAESGKRVEEVRKMVAAVKALPPGKDEGSPLMGMPVHYLLDLRGYDPAAEAAKLSVPLLIVQGERDYQVTMKDFANWKAALGTRKDVTLKAYPALNHLFSSGEGKSSPAEYQKPGNVAPEVIDDIAKWVAAH